MGRSCRAGAATLVFASTVLGRSVAFASDFVPHDGGLAGKQFGLLKAKRPRGQRWADIFVLDGYQAGSSSRKFMSDIGTERERRVAE